MHGINEFSRSRKRISVVVRKNGVGWIFVKGVDSTMLEHFLKMNYIYLSQIIEMQEIVN